ncbi:amidohydrolase family protein [Cryptosporangium phraense]|uniref:Amidohydrolase family protein n=1 Tax=Cryptosporangium phraense TaxID=2593070 RepID=A0A545B0E1_9ACTN|nr:amidohydrolase family protein [Cryptosporangium phraense]TQS47028.1 amidohydrolase family protein [Cryptosporangium phraense]
MLDPSALRPGEPVALLRDVRTLAGETVDLQIVDGRAAAAADAEPEMPGAVVDATGWLVLPALGEPHAHLDKALTVDRGSSRLNSLLDAVDQWHRMLPDINGPDVRERAERALAQYAAAGVTAIRTHVDVPPDGDALRCLRAVLELRDEVADRMTVQVIPLISPATPLPVIEAAVAEGVDGIGGVPHLADDPAAETARLLDVAERSGLPVDLHTDEALDLHGLDLEDLARQVLARGLEQRVTASHCVRLSLLPPERLATTLDKVAEAGIGIVVLPQTNLFLQGRDRRHSVPRAIAPVRAMLEAGIEVAAGGDNLRDPFNAVGRGDPLETASLLVAAAHVHPGEALEAVTGGVRRVLGLPDADSVADLVLVPAQSLTSIVAGPGDARVVLRGGTVLASTRVERATALTREPQEV